MKEFGNVKFIKVKAHNGVKWNEIADKKASEAAIYGA